VVETGLAIESRLIVKPNAAKRTFPSQIVWDGDARSLSFRMQARRVSSSLRAASLAAGAFTRRTELRIAVKDERGAEDETEHEQREVDPNRSARSRESGTHAQTVPPHIRKTPKRVSRIGAYAAASKPSARTRRVSSGSITPSSHRRAVA
jgi:hypothetical protein